MRICSNHKLQVRNRQVKLEAPWVESSLENSDRGKKKQLAAQKRWRHRETILCCLKPQMVYSSQQRQLLECLQALQRNLGVRVRGQLP